jgi:NTE family protein
MAEALLDAGIHPDLIVGSSAGALNGAFLAGNPGPEGAAKLRDLWLTVRRRDVFPLSPDTIKGLLGRRDYLVSSKALERWLTTHAPFERIEQATIPLHIMATDLMTGVAVRLSAGNVITALLASSAIPGIFPPVQLEARLLIDGGIAADTAIGEAVALGADTIYVLPTVGTDSRKGPPRSPASVFLQAMAHILRRSAEAEIAASAGRCRLYVVPPPTMDDVSPFSFARSLELMDRARVVAQEWLETATPFTQFAAEP